LSTIGTGGTMGIRYLTPGLRIVLVSGRDNRGAGYHARVPAPTYSLLGKAPRDDNPFARRNWPRNGCDPDIGNQQVLLSFGLPFAIVPLILFTRRRDLMGELVNRHFTTILISCLALLVLSLNGYLLYELFLGQ
jgi:hypothetical protein